MDAVVFKDLSLLFNAVGAGNCFLLAYSTWQPQRAAGYHRNLLLSLLFIVIGASIANTILNLSGYHSFVPAFEPVNNALLFSMPPLLYLLVQNAEHPLKKVLGSRHFFVCYLFLSITLCSLLFRGSHIGDIGMQIIKHPLMPALWNCYFLGYLALGLSLQRGWEPGKHYWLQVLFKGIALIWLLNLMAYGYRTLLGPIPAVVYLNITLLFTILVCWLTYFRFTKNRAAFWTYTPVTSTPSHSKITGVCPISTAIVQNRYYRDPNLTIRSLAGKLNVPYHVLSQQINQVHGKNFNAFINSFRLAEVEQALRAGEQQSFTIMGLATRAGFKSASSFYSAFKNKTGLTPREFLQARVA